MGRVAAAAAALVALVLLGAPPGAGAELSAVFQRMAKFECHFINGTERVRYVERYIYNRFELARFDSDVGRYEGFSPYGEKQAECWNSRQEWMENIRSAVDWFCRAWYKTVTPFAVERSVPPSVSISLLPSSSQPGPDRLLCSVLDFYPAQIQLLVLLETPPRSGVTYTCQVEHVSLEQPLRQRWEMPPDAARSKMLTGIGGSCWARSSWRWGSASTCARRAPEPPAAAAPPRGLGPARDPPLRPRARFGGGSCPLPPQSPPPPSAAVTLPPPGCSQCSQ
ncbi:class II histocompatibility antigen, B-L beta chain-like [Oenanthe melanoleuca]|uniref:class II histocompatibility antigen, B-L beta chain-like n=1 Tax=Oenanthe melanoleuca TaxID=2939378 RepID=UPI0024C1B5EC|nr:class II histocompatibility antigen, B-L beta chain-like [Oenanthe melanoleuca]